jgi:hypothetical protein
MPPLGAETAEHRLSQAKNDMPENETKPQVLLPLQSEQNAAARMTGGSNFTALTAHR